MDPGDQRVKPVEVELSRNLQMYLQRLGLLPKKSPAFGLSATGKVELPPNFCLKTSRGTSVPRWWEIVHSKTSVANIIISETNLEI